MPFEYRTKDEFLQKLQQKSQLYENNECAKQQPRFSKVEHDEILEFIKKLPRKGQRSSTDLGQ